MLNKWYLLIILIFKVNIVSAQHPEHVEVYFEIISSGDETFFASANAPTFVPPDNQSSGIPPTLLGG